MQAWRFKLDMEAEEVIIDPRVTTSGCCEILTIAKASRGNLLPPAHV